MKRSKPKCYKHYKNRKCLGDATKKGTTASKCKLCKWLERAMQQ